MQNSKNDIATEADIELMVNTFYAKVKADLLLGPVFNDFAQVEWEKHLPKMYTFWNKLILGKAGYIGNPFSFHIPLPINQDHFNRWLALFEQNIDDHFSGDVAERTKLRAKSIAHIFASKLAFIK